MPASNQAAMINDLLEGAGHIVIVSHMHPDGDALGSSTAMLHYLKGRGMEAEVVLPGPIQEALGFISCSQVTDASAEPGKAESLISSCDLLICLDFNSLGRAGILEPLLRASAAPKILIDHHLSPAEDEFTVCVSRTDVSSASEVLYQVLMQMPDICGDVHRLPKACAESLMVGMTTDTNNFANSVFPSTLEMASSLLAAGVDRDGILSHIYNEYRENRVRAMGYLLGENLRITGDGVAYMILDRSSIRRFDLQDGETEGFVNIPLSIGKVKISILLKEDDGHFRVSIRSKRGISANMLARGHFNGGGHEQAAGGRLYFPQDIAAPEDAAEYIEQVTARFMRDCQPPKK